MKYRFVHWLLCSCPVAAAVFGGCAYEPPTVNPTGTGGNGQGGMAQGGSTSSAGGEEAGGAGGAMAGTGGAMGGAGGGTGGAGGACTEGSTLYCNYDGPGGTENVGTCKVSERMCANGTWSNCSKQVLPVAEGCNGVNDTNCDKLLPCAGAPIVPSTFDGHTLSNDMVLSVATAGGKNGYDGPVYAVGFHSAGFLAQSLLSPRVLVLRRDPFGTVVNGSEGFAFVPNVATNGGAFATGVSVNQASGDFVIGGTYFDGKLSVAGSEVGSAAAPKGFLAAFSASLTKKFVLDLGVGGSVEVFAVATDTTGNVFVAGSYWGAPDFGDKDPPPVQQQQFEGFVASYTSEGAVRWVKAIQGANVQSVRAMTISAGDPIIAMTFTGVTLIPDIAGTTPDAGATPDALLARLDGATGTIKWATQVACNDEVKIGGIAADSTTVALTGSFRGTLEPKGPASGGPVHQNISMGDPSDGFVATYAVSDGNFQKSRHFSLGGSVGGVQEPHGIAIDSFGDIVIIGEFSNTLPITQVAEPTNGDLLNRDAFVIKLDGNLDGRWGRRFGDGAPQIGMGVAIGTGTGHIFAGGGFQGSLTEIMPSPKAIGVSTFDAFLIEISN